MPSISVPKELSPAAWEKHNAAMEKEKDKPNQKLDWKSALTRINTLSSKIAWDDFDPSALKTAAEAEKMKADLLAAWKSTILKVSAETDNVADAWDFIVSEGRKIKTFPKDIVNAAMASSKAAWAYKSQVDDAFQSAQAAIDSKIKQLGAAGAKGGAAKTAGGGAGNKADDQLLMKLSKKAVAFAMKPKPGAKPMQFSVIGKKGTPIKVLMGTKTEVAKLIGKFWKVDPATKKKPVLAKDPASKVLFENGALIFESAKISNGYLGSMKKALVAQIKKGPKVKWRKPGHPDEEASGGGEDLKAEDVHVEDDKVDAAAMAKAASEFNGKFAVLKKNANFNPKAKGDLGETITEMLKAVAKKDYVEALDLADAVEALLDTTPAETDDDEITPVGKTAAAGQPAAKTAAGQTSSMEPAAKKAAGDDGVAAATKLWANTRDAAFKEVATLKAEIAKMYPKGDAAVEKAMKDIDASLNKVKSIDTALAGIGSLAESKRGPLVNGIKSTIDNLIKHVESDKIMANLDANEVMPIKASATLKQGLSKLSEALR